MTDSTETPAIDAFVAALRDPSTEHADAARTRVATDAQVMGPFGGGSGIAAFDALLEHPLVSRLVANAEWSAPVRDGDVVTVTAAAPPAAGVGGFRFGLHLDDQGRIDRIEQDLLPAAPSEPAPIALSDAHATLLAEALANGTPMIVAYVDADRAPHLSFRATVQVVGPDRLGMWIRDPQGGLVRALATNPHLSCFYTDRAKGVTLQFSGRAAVDPDAAMRDRIYDGSPEPERNMDWRKRGVAVVVELDHVEGRDGSGRVLMARAR
jgi:hypothetical protein